MDDPVGPLVLAGVLVRAGANPQANYRAHACTAASTAPLRRKGRRPSTEQRIRPDLAHLPPLGPTPASLSYMWHGAGGGALHDPGGGHSQGGPPHLSTAPAVAAVIARPPGPAAGPGVCGPSGGRRGRRLGGPRGRFARPRDSLLARAIAPSPLDGGHGGSGVCRGSFTVVYEVSSCTPAGRGKGSA